jgi:hypothetical protein
MKEQLAGMNEWRRHRPEIMITSVKNTFENILH